MNNKDLMDQWDNYIDSMGGVPMGSVEQMAQQMRDNLQTLADRDEVLAAAHGKLWSALADIVEAQTAQPNATVRRIIAYAERALIEDTVSTVKPVPRFYT